jgi:hypothetical protein
MPYNIPNETPDETGRMERCVADLVAKGKDKSTAVAICKSSIMKKDKKEDLDLQTTISIIEGALDEAKMTVEACVLSPCISGNKRYYSPQIVEKASTQLVGLKSYADHDDRSARNIIAKIGGARFENGRAFATFKFSKAKDIAESIFTRIKEGIITDVSIAASGATQRVKMNEEWVDEVTDIKIRSVDFVSEGGVPDAKVIRVFESNEIPETHIEELKETMNLDELKKTYPELVAELKAEFEKPVMEELDKSKKELEAIKAKIMEREVADLRAKLVSEIQENEIVKKLVSEMVTGSSEEEIKKSISENLELVKKIREATAKVEGNPAVVIESTKKKIYSSSKEILGDPELSEAQKAELITKLWF